MTCGPAAARRARTRRPAPNSRSAHLAQPAGLHVVDEAADRVLVGDERAGLDAGDRLAHVLVDVVEGLGRPLGLDPRLLLELGLEVVVVEGEHPAVGVVDEDDLLGPEQALRMTWASPSSRPSAP